MSEFSLSAFANYKSEEVKPQSLDFPSLEIPSQQVSWPTRQCFASEKNDTTLGVMDKIFSGGAWLDPKMYLVRNEKKDFSPRKIYQDKYTREWRAKERNGREIIVGVFDLDTPLFVNPRGPTTFDTFYVEMEHEGKKYPISLRVIQKILID